MKVLFVNRETHRVRVLIENRKDIRKFQNKIHEIIKKRGSPEPDNGVHINTSKDHSGYIVGHRDIIDWGLKLPFLVSFTSDDQENFLA